MENHGRDNSMLRYFLGYKNEEKCCLPLQTHKNSIFRQYSLTSVSTTANKISNYCKNSLLKSIKNQIEFENFKCI